MDLFFSPLIQYHIQVFCIQLKVHGAKSVVLQNIIIAVLLTCPCTKLFTLIENMLCVET